MFASEQTAEQAAQYSALGAAMAGGLGTAGMPGMLPNAGIMQMVDPNTKTLLSSHDLRSLTATLPADESSDESDDDSGHFSLSLAHSGARPWGWRRGRGA